MIGFYAAGAMGVGGGGGGTLYDAIMAHNPFMYFRLGETSGTTATNSGSGPDGTYSGSYSLGNTPLYTGGLPSYGITGTSARATFPGASVPSSTSGLTIGVFSKVANVTGIHYYVNRDAAGLGPSGSRYWQFRNNGANMEFIRLVGGGAVTISRSHGLGAGDTLFAAVVVSPTGIASLFKNGIQLSAGESLGAANFGGGVADIVVGNFTSHYSEASAGDFHSEAFVVANALTPANIAEIAVAGGFA